MKPLLLLLLLAGLLAGPALTARAQMPTTPAASTYAAEYDSLQQRVARVRTRIDQGIVRFKSGFVAIAGTSRRTRSYALGKRLHKLSRTDAPTFPALVKKQVIKHKTQGIEVEKVRYYGARQRLLLYEYYEQHQLIHQKLYEYATRAKSTACLFAPLFGCAATIWR